MKILQNGKDSFDETYNDYADTLYRIALSYLGRQADAEDAVHDVFVKYIRHPDSYRDQDHKRAWLIRVTVNRCKDMLRKRSLTEGPSLSELGDIAQYQSDSGIMDALRVLDAKYKTPVILHYLEGYSVNETADILSISVSAVKMRLSRGRQMLSKILKEGER